MPFYKHYSQDDVNLGDAYENSIKPKLEQLFGPLTQRSKEMNRNEVFDFSNDQVYIDVKRRRNTKTKYPTTMVGENKVIQGLQYQAQGKRVFFVFGFTDEDCIWELNREEYQVEYGGRYDRGSPEIKSYSYIPIKYLCDIKNYATEEKISMGSPPTRVSQETSEDEIEPSHDGSIEDLPEERT